MFSAILFLFAALTALAVVLDECMEKCEFTPACASDPKGSYCKSWATPKVCFGLYQSSSRSFCFSPNDKSCDHKNLPPAPCSGISFGKSALLLTSTSTSKPIRSVQISSTPISSVPVSSTLISSVQIRSSPISSVPVSSTPLIALIRPVQISSSPISSVQISSKSISSVQGSSSPISSVQISSSPISSVQISSTSVTTTSSSTHEPSTFPLADYCQFICNKVPKCKNDPGAHGSYCKYWQQPAVCFGLYVKSWNQYCFQPNDPSCNDRWYRPLECVQRTTKPPCTTNSTTRDAITTRLSSSRMSTSSVIPPSTTAFVTTSSSTSSSTITSSTQSSTSTSSRASTSTRTPTSSLPSTVSSSSASSSSSSMASAITSSFSGSTTSSSPSSSVTYASTTIPPKGLCDIICGLLPACRNDPHAHGTYCKVWQTPPVCFGIYIRPATGWCYQPNDPNCFDRTLTPQLC